MAAQRFDFEVRVVSLVEGGMHVVQCLNYDVAAQGETAAEALAAWKKAFIHQVTANLQFGKGPMEDVPPAPSYYFKLAENADEGDQLEIIERADAPEDAPPPWILQAHAKVFTPQVAAKLLR